MPTRDQQRRARGCLGALAAGTVIWVAIILAVRWAIGGGA